jgi:hypothetical protein
MDATVNIGFNVRENLLVFVSHISKGYHIGLFETETRITGPPLSCFSVYATPGS